MKKYVAAQLLFFMVASSGNAATPDKGKIQALNCQTNRLADGGKVALSIVLREEERSADVGEQFFHNVDFSSYRISGVLRHDNKLVAGVSRETSFSLDRINGKFSMVTIPVATNGGDFTDEQISRLSQLPLDPDFVGFCTPAARMF